MATAALAGMLLPASSAAPVEVTVLCDRQIGSFRALHGVNKGPLAAGGTIDLTPQFQRLQVPAVRLHDCQWPYPDVIDVHAIFRNPRADPADPASYDFALTDAYLAAVKKTGAEIIYRLGESIEHMEPKRFVHPPSDPKRWTDVCLGIIRHYNEGWAGGARYGIRYWEIWNEPENRPAMWTGTEEEFITLYKTAAVTIKRAFPNLKVGGPALGNSGAFQNGKFVPTSFVTNFLASLRRDSVPLDFFSWHCYTADPDELVQRASAIRELLDHSGFPHSESHLNEWNYLPDQSWDGLARRTDPLVRARWYSRMSGAEGATFLASALVRLQDAPVDACNLFHGELGGFGLFNEFGVPHPNYYALDAFNQLVRLAPGRLQLKVSGPSRVTAAAGAAANQSSILLLLTNPAEEQTVELKLDAAPWRRSTHWEVLNRGSTLPSIRRVESASGKSSRFILPRYGVALLKASPSPSTGPLP